MSKIVRLTDELRAQCRDELEQALAQMKLADGKFTFTKTFSYDKRRATVFFTPEAWAKMVMLIKDFDKEVAWHGVAKRGEDEEKDEYIISDILVYPQEVTGSTVNTDQEAYQFWLMSQEDEVFNNLRMQGHSHVNMGTTPSGVDLTHQEKILEQLEDDMFYIFMIWNKSFSNNTKIYDMKKNVLFEAGDVDVKIFGGGIDLDSFLKDAKDLVKTRSYQPQNGTVYYPYDKLPAYDGRPYNPVPSTKPEDTKKTAAAKPPVTPKKPTDKPKGKPKSHGGYDNASDDFDPTDPFNYRDSYFGSFR